MDASHFNDLIRKYDIPTPRYTSYPTVPFWDESTLPINEWQNLVYQSFIKTQQEGISLYIHLPFCEKLCTYCGCNKRITLNHQVEEPYIEAVLKEWDMYLAVFGRKPRIAELHLGGGTPTFFSAHNLNRLLGGILDKAEKAEGYEFSLEAHPNSTTAEQLKILFDWGFKRLSVGIQDFDPKVQYIINRPQSFEKTKEVIDAAREIGYDSVNADIIYGLPLQTEASVRMTVDKVRELMPERIAFYSYAHVPWKSPAQRRYTEADLPVAEAKRHLYEVGRQLFKEAGYEDIGMDHFALRSDSLWKASQKGQLHRNFMGYTARHTELLLGLGVSSIGDSWTGFMQNIKEVEAYEEAIAKGQFPLAKGHRLSEEDLVLRKHILKLMCQGHTSWEDGSLSKDLINDILLRIKPLETDGLVELEAESIRVTETGRAFLRNIAMQLDARYWQKESAGRVFSRSI
jgi:oxygen-independent coproporphyrinogen III oxidase